MITVGVDDLTGIEVPAVLRPVDATGAAVTPVARDVERAAGPTIVDRCAGMGEMPIGSAVLTGAGTLPADYLVHVVVCSRDEPVTAAGVRRGLTNGLRRLAEWEIPAVALPPLGTGAGNFDADTAAGIMIPLLLANGESSGYPSRVMIVAADEYERDAFERELGRRGDDPPADADSRAQEPTGPPPG